MADKEKESTPLDRAKCPGGVYGSSDGRFHNAHGQEVTEAGELVEPAAVEGEESEENVTRRRRRK